MSSVIELRAGFDSLRWKVEKQTGPLGSSLLLTWVVDQEPVDAGVPLLIRAVLAETLCAVGSCWFAGDTGDGVSVATLNLRRGLSWRRASIFRANRVPELLPAFESGAHDWSMAAQWIVVGSRDSASNDQMVAAVRTLLEDWKLPDEWPADVSAIIQAGVDGDAAGFHCRTRAVEDDLRRAVQRSATAHGVAVHLVD